MSEDQVSESNIKKDLDHAQKPKDSPNLDFDEFSEMDDEWLIAACFFCGATTDSGGSK